MISNKQTHHKGLVGELEFALHLINNGWSVFTPLDQNSRIDMIILKEGKILKIQVKYCKPNKGCLKIDLQHRTRRTLPYSNLELDAVGLYEPTNKKYYLIPYEKFYPRQGIWLRIADTNNNQTRGINWAKDYEI